MEVSKPIIRISNLRKSYGSKEILKGINLDIYPGQVIGYIGPNGAGKSTTVKILTGLINDFEGEVMVNDIDIKENPLAIKSQIGYVPENAELYDVLTPLEYLDFVGQLYGMENTLIQQRSQQLLKAFGLEQNINNRMDTFSKGMRQKVLLISGIIHNPQIIVLDEPLSGLDANAVIIVKELISLLAKEGKTIFYCSHMMDVVEKVSDRIMLISEGHIIADGTFEQLKTYQSESLEQIFSKLTGKEDGSVEASHIISAIR
ncbi:MULTISPECIES: ABC transporter ATP-binding protein [Sphingobacterium]|jgi:ABC-2 type transport system ATP-binding protein|uniref:ABC transporter ATP-binding protein n=1 Tax=Sphingobacterium TaxID=28453 RepID=UPI0004E5EFFA|nr:MULTISPECIES: ABC transporter ATP-binding protein [Sphingobacterium]CDS91429.1 Fe(3+)-transporting ATPase [Sphingobacterium sp. PM2-P1-29]SJN17457.1 ABC transporter ATP-binding protein [Sphingobacterium faecium PCAi_F2.5]UPZ38490.1 ABC transporter ATP-binding protein [Sphingobacterium sp. PCS056]UXD69923.1 ABC transporter ATP-binding protein [Sphingobacterium faecium]WGQ13472.1 ABC transporter ATP-binding protein [Sphingobacterium faecium]